METPDTSADRWVAFAWILVLPLAALEWVLLGVILPRTVRAPDLSQVSKIFLPSVGGWLRPEPLEQARYVGGIVAAFLLYCGAALFYRRWAKNHPPPGPKVSLGLGRVAVAIQLSLCAAAIYLWGRNASESLAYFPWVFFAGALVVGVAVGAAFRAIARREPKTGPVTARPWPRLLALCVLIVGLLPSVFTTGTIAHAHWSVIYHTWFSSEDFAAVLQGHTPLVDYAPQYQLFLPFLTVPFFRLFGLSVTSFSLLMTLLSATELVLAYLILRCVARSDWGATVLFIPFAAMSFFPVQETAPPLERYYSYNVYMQHPLRTFGPWLVAFLCVRYLAGPSLRRMVAVFVVAAFAAVNNVDFGLPAFLASIAAILATSDVGLLPSPKKAGRALLVALAAAAVAVSVFIGICLIRSGSPPHFGHWLEVQRTYVLYGYGMLPMPNLGIYWIVFGTFLADLALALLWLARDESGDPALRLRCGTLIFSGIFGLGASMYYVGRSHPWSLIVIFSFWAFSVSLLLWEAYIAYRLRPSLKRFWLSVVPTGFLIAHFSICLLAIVEVAQPFGQIERLSLRSPVFADRMTELAAFVGKHAAAGESVVISFPYGHLLGMEAGVDNVFPFGFGGELLTFSQLDELMDTIQKHHVTRVFGQLRPEVVARLATVGFQKGETLPASSVPLLGTPCELWERPAAVAVREPRHVKTEPIAASLNLF